MEDTRRLVLSILQFIDEQQRSPDLSPDAIESLEVASQCLESAYKISIRDVDAVAQFNLPAQLPQIFNAGLNNLSSSSVADKESAEKLKAQGNEYMKQESYEAAIKSYTDAIKNDPRNAVYYCNRAAAYGKLGNHTKSIEDCQAAITIDSTYAKAYGRKGLAHSALNQHKQAKECYQKASELDPTNESYKDNLKMAEQSLRSDGQTNASTTGTAAGGLGGLNLTGVDFNSLFSSPAVMNIATTMLTNPQLQTMMANMMTGMTAGGTEDSQGTMGLDRLLQVGQQFAQQMQEMNPDLVEQLRSQMTTGTTPPNESAHADPPNNHNNNSENGEKEE